MNMEQRMHIYILTLVWLSQIVNNCFRQLPKQ